jgi:Tfp pilus assembly protein PilV
MSLTLLPNWLRELLLALLVLLLGVLSAWGYGKYEYRQGVKAQEAIQVNLETKVDASSLAATLPIITRLDAIKVQYQGTTTTIVKEVPTYVTKEDDARCPVPNSFVSVWNSTNKMQLSPSASSVPSGTSDVVLSDIEAQHAIESGICHNNEATLQSVSDWLRAQMQVYNTTK